VQEKAQLAVWNRELKKDAHIYEGKKKLCFSAMTDEDIFRIFFKVRTGTL
jgi:hypothetical protein